MPRLLITSRRGSVGGVYLAWLHDLAGSYDVAIVAAGIVMLSGLLMMTLRRPGLWKTGNFSDLTVPAAGLERASEL